jgi:HSP20 family protein
MKIYTCYGSGHQRGGFEKFGKFLNDLVNEGVEAIEHEFAFSRPSANIFETDDRYELQLAAPGLQKSDFTIKVEGDMLVISVKKEMADEKREWIRKGFNYNDFSRQFKVREDVDTSGIKASYEDGILKVTLPKSKTNGARHTIDID